MVQFCPFVEIKSLFSPSSLIFSLLITVLSAMVSRMNTSSFSLSLKPLEPALERKLRVCASPLAI
jgi:hypothetical protein